MKYLIFSFCFLQLNISLAATSIQDALKDDLVVVKIILNDNSTHYHTPFILEVENKSKQSQNLVLDNGTVFLAADNSDQDFIVTQEELLALNAGKKIKVEIHAMCLEQYNGAPNEDSKYTIGPLANRKLRKLSTFIEENKKFEPDAQFLMWDIAEGYYLEDQLDDFVIDSNGAVWVVDVVDGVNIVLDEGTFEVPQSESKLIVTGTFTMNFSRPQNIHIAMFNAQNVLVKELFKEANCPIGENGLRYSFDSFEYPEEEYFVKLVVDGKVKFTRRIEMSH